MDGITTAVPERVLLRSLREGSSFWDEEQELEGTVRLKLRLGEQCDIRLMRYTGPNAGHDNVRVPGSWLVRPGRPPDGLKEQWLARYQQRLREEQRAVALKAAELRGKGMSWAQIGGVLGMGESQAMKLVQLAAELVVDPLPPAAPVPIPDQPQPTPPVVASNGDGDSTERDQEALQLREQGVTLSDIAKRLGFKNVRAVKSALQRAHPH